MKAGCAAQKLQFDAHGKTFDDPVFRDLLVRAFKWTVKRE